MKYILAKLTSEYPSINAPEVEGLRLIGGVDSLSIYEVPDDKIWKIPSVFLFTEIEEQEALHFSKFHCEGRQYRLAYSDVEGLEPDEDELAKGKRKTKIYMDEECEHCVLNFMKKVAKFEVELVYMNRSNTLTKQMVLNEIDSIQTRNDMFIWKEKMLGVEMPKAVAQSLNLWDDTANQRIDIVDHSLGF